MAKGRIKGKKKGAPRKAKGNGGSGLTTGNARTQRRMPAYSARGKARGTTRAGKVASGG